MRSPLDLEQGEKSGKSGAGNSKVLELLLKKRGVEAPRAGAIPPRTGEGPWPLSFSQERLWFLDRLEPGGATYNLPTALRLQGPLDPLSWTLAVREVVRRHEALRTRFSQADGAPVQWIDPPRAIAPPLVDLRALPEAARLEEARRLTAEEARRPFDLERGPLLRTALLRLAAEDHAILITMHHIVSDGWSLEIFVSEVTALYQAFLQGRPSRLPPLPIQYADFAVWQRQWMRGEVLERELSYWKERLAGAPPELPLPADRPRPAVQSSRGATLRFQLSPGLAGRLRDVGLRQGATLFMTLLTGYFALLSRCSGQSDVLVGTPVAGRTRPELLDLIGFFVNTQVLRADLAADPGFTDLLRRVREITLDAQAHQDLPFEKLVAELAPERNLSRSPLFQVMFVLRNATERRQDLSGVQTRSLDAASSSSPFDLTLVMEEGREELGGSLEFSTDLFDLTTIRRFARHFETLLEAAVARPGEPLSSHELLAESERQQILVEWNDGAGLPPRLDTLPALIAEQMARRPEAPAVVHSGETLSYAELDRRAGRLARRLRALGVGPEIPVGIFLDRSPALIVAVLGVLQAGGFYVPVDPANSRERLGFILDDARVGVLLTEERLRDALPPGSNLRILFLDALGAAPGDTGAEEPEALDSGLDGSHLAYLLYTSGSTGTPKGVAVPHRAVACYSQAAAGIYGVTAEDRVLQFSSLGFDASVEEIFTSLTQGATLVLRTESMMTSAAHFLEECAALGLTVLDLPTAYWHTLVAELEPGGLPASVRLVILGGEKAQADRLEAWRERVGPGVRLVNSYGPTETTVVATWCDLADRPEIGPGRRPIPIGRAVPGARIHLLDPALRPVVPGAAGEICIAGEGVARGYLGRPALTAERFVPDPFGRPGDRLYRSGDLARWRADGELEYLGRRDDQVKIRGFRIEPGEIEAALSRHPAVAEVAVLAVETGSGEKRLVAYAAVGTPQVMSQVMGKELREFLSAALPPFMVPSTFILLASLPWTSSGKVDRRALSRMEIERSGEPERELAAPRTPTEEILAGLWEQMLESGPVGREDDFFRLGGHSLLAMQTISRIRQTFGVDLPLRDLFEEPALERVAARIDRALRTGAGLARPPLRKVPREQAIPLSWAQQRLWLVDQLDPGGATYNMPLALRLAGALDRRALARALNEIARRHEVLRTVFPPADGEPVQVILPPVQGDLPLVDLSALPGDRREALLPRLAAEEAARPFDLARGPLWRSVLLRLDEGEHALFLTLHHIVSDGWSMGLLNRELVALYTAFSRGASSPLPELPFQYADYAVWQRSWLRGEVLESELNAWRSRLAGAPPTLDLPTDRPRAAVRTSRGAAVPMRWTGSLADRLRALSRARRVTLFTTLLSAFQALLARLSGQRDLNVGTVVAGRGHQEIEGLIGFFVNTLVLRGDLSGDPRFSDLLGRSREVLLAAHTHQEVPFEKLVEELAPERSLAHSPLFQVMLVLQSFSGRSGSLGDLRVRPVEVAAAGSKFDLTLAVEERESELRGVWEHSTDLFDGATIARWAGHLETLLTGALADPERRLSELPLLKPEEQAQVLREWNDSRPAAGAGPLERFLEQARLRPEAAALVSEDGEISSGDLDRRSARLARRLRALGVGPEKLTALFFERSPDLVVALLGVLRAGGAYLPLDPATPRERLAFLLEDSGSAVLLTAPALRERLPAGTAPILELGVEPAEEPDGDLSDIDPDYDPDRLAYVIYTSGSTGRPKGVELSLRGLDNLIGWHLRAYGLGPGDRATQVANPAFDASVWEIWPVLAAGASLWFPPEEVRSAPPVLLSWLARRGITHCFLPTPLAEAVIQEAPPEGLALRFLLTGGDKLHRAPERELPFRLVNHYGPTESTVVTTAGVVEPAAPDAAAVISIGRPVAGLRVRVIDRDLCLVPPGVPGELCVAGVGLARGYRFRPDLTADRFVPDPWSLEPGGRLYRTGDLVRWLPQGELEFLGRLDHQVKLRGFRIELGEIEAVLGSHPRLREALVLVTEGGPGPRRLAAYVVPEPEAEVPPADLKEFLRERLPEYMVPAVFVVLDAFPLTPNGKVDRKALARIEPVDGDPAEEPAVRRTLSEEVIAGIWADVLGRERVGSREDFFDLGGHSLLATRVVSRLQRAFGVDIPLRDLFEAPTVEGLARRVDARSRAGAGIVLPPLVPVPRDRPLPLSFAQQRLWLIDQLEPGNPQYNIPVALRMTGRLEASALAAALSEIQRRHEVLRTVFVPTEGEPVQVVLPASPFALPVVDLSGLSEAEREVSLTACMTEEAGRPFDLARGPLWRAALLRLAPEDHALLLTLHHVVSDGWSMGVLLREVSVLYAAFLAGEPSPLPDLPIQYADFAVWQRSWLQGEVLDRELAHWRRELAGAPPVLELPTDRPRPSVRSSRGAVWPLRMSPAASGSLAALARSLGATPFMVLLAGFQALLGRLSGGAEISAGTPVAGRNRIETEGLIGFFVNTLVLRTDLSGTPGFGELIRRVREVSLRAHAHQDIPFEKLVEALEPERSLSHSPLFQAFFVLQNNAREEGGLRGLRSRALESEETAARFDLTLTFQEAEAGWAGAFEYSTDLFDRSTIARWSGQLARLLEAAGAEPERPLAELPWLGEGEAAQVLWEWNAEGETRPALASLLQERFETQARENPEAVALVFEGGSWSYGALNLLANRLAHRLRRLGIGPDSLVGVCLERRPEMVASLLAVLKAGGAYAPLDPRYPADRLGFMLADAEARVVLTERKLVSALPRGSAHLLLVDEPEGLAEEPESDPVPSAGAGNLAYVIYTSGSTGRPKGVALEHRSAIAFIDWAAGLFSAGELAGVLAATSISFDLSVFEIFLPLSAGGRVILADDALHLASLAAAGEVTLINTVPSALSELLRLEAVPPSVRTINLAGEPLPRALAERIHELPSVERLYNLYGPTEDTTYSTWALVERGSSGSPSIGRAIAGSRAWLLDRDLRPVGVGVVGELYLGGEGLARGYLNRPELTAERFVPDPFAGRLAEPGARLYRTGDLARWRPEGALDFLGRIDHQVKVRGFRIELGEIETALGASPGVREAVVLVREDRPGDRRLVAYVVGAEGAPLSASEIRSHLRERLPEHMVPSAVVVLDALPLTPNGKVDRRALPTPAEPGETPVESEAPRSPVEELLAAIWGEVLRRERVGVRESFFDLGGHSLLATQVASRVRRVFGVDLPLRALFEEPTVERLARRVEEALRSGAGLAAPPIVPVPRDRPLPLSFAQQRLWFIDQLEPGSPSYNIPLALRVRGGLDPSLLAASFSEIARRHEALRTVFAASEGEPVQVILPPAPVSVPVLDLAGLPGPAREKLLATLAAEEAGRPFDLEAGPLWRIHLLRLGAEESVLLLTLHHIVSDGWSMGLLMREVSALYTALQAGRPSPLTELPVQYADFAVWQRAWLQGEILERELGSWRRQLSGAPAVLELPTDRPRPPVRTSRGAAWPVQLPAGIGERLAALGRRTGATPFMVLLAGFQALLGRYSGQSDISVGTPVAGRNRLEIEGLIGFFVNTLVLRTDLSGDPGFAPLVERVREVSLAAHTHQEVPFERLVEELGAERSLSHTPLFQVMFSLQNEARERNGMPGLRVETLTGSGSTAKFDLSLTLGESPGTWGGELRYSLDLFDEPTVRRMAGHLAGLLDAASRSPEAALSALPLLSAEEQAQLAAWNDTGRSAPPFPSVPAMFAAAAERTPEAAAVIFEDRSLSYRELAGRAARLAARLRALGAGPDERVGICLERSESLIVAILGIFQAGGAYVPMDPDMPLERRALVVRDSGARAVLVDDPERSDLLLPGGPGIPLLAVEAGADESVPLSRPAAEAGPEHLAYVIYTSGSTGAPKGVAVEHRQLSNYVQGVLERMALPAGASFATVSTIAADLGNTVVFASLCTGGTLQVISRERLSDPRGMAEALRRHPVDCLKIVPSHLAALMSGEQPADVLPRRLLVLGGEASRWPLMDRIRELAPACRILNHYGPTETTVGVLTWPVEDGPSGRRAQTVPLGRPLGNVQAWLLDRDLRPVPVGVPGELYLGGDNVSRGYWGRPDLTAERFLPDPFGKPGSRLYRTGDLTRRLEDGAIEFLGRIDLQVKIRGFRIELGEIETVLRQHPGLMDAAVLARAAMSGTSTAGEPTLTAFLAPREGAPASLLADVRSWLRQRLPQAMIPAAFTVLETLPLTPNGKVDRKALARRAPAPEPELLAEDAEGFLAPRTPTEEIVAGLWSEVLGRERISSTDDFFEIGGHSLLATRVLSRLRRTFRLDLPLRDLFESSTLAALARRIDEALQAGPGESGEVAPPITPPIVQVDRGRPLVLSFGQLRLWIIDQLEPGSAQYNIPIALEMSGPLRIEALAASLSAIAGRHEVLRTVFAPGHGESVEPVQPGEPVQVILPAAPVPLPVVDLSGLPLEIREAAAAGLAAEESQRPFDLARGPLWRATLLRRGGQEHALLLTLHHIVSDGWSRGILLREMAALYRACVTGEPPALAPLPVQYADFAAWQRSWLQGETLERSMGYWRRQLAGAPPVLELPTDRPRPPVRSPRGGEVPIRFSAEIAERLRTLARRTGSTSFMVLLAGLQTLLGRLSGQPDVSVGTPLAGRNRIETEGLIGFFINTLVLRTDLSGDPSFHALLERVRDLSLEAHAHQEVPFEKLVEELEPARSLAHTPLFQVLFVLQNTPRERAGVGGLRLRNAESGASTAKFDLSLALAEAGSGLSGAVEHSADLFDPATVTRWAGHLVRLLEAAAETPERPLSHLPGLGEGETAQVLWEWNAEAGERTALAALLHERFEAQARKTPDAVALVFEGEDESTWSYGVLNRRANRLAHRLRGLGVGPEVLVGVCLERGPELIAGLLAVLKAGGAYVPLDPRYPADRLGFMLADAEARVVLTERKLLPALPESSAHLLLVDEPDGLAGELESDPVPTAGAAHLAYVIYTSGSTGRPKGVALEHRSATAFVGWAARAFSAAELSGVLAATSVSFDLSIFEIFVPLSIGTRVILAADALHLARHPAAGEVTLINTVPSALSELLLLEAVPPSVRTINLAGEPLQRALVERAHRLPFVERLYNLYGPTEDTTYSTWALIERGSTGAPSIGRAIAGSRVCLLDRDLRPVGLGVAGELYLGGEGLAREYLKRPELTAERFVPDPFAEVWGEPGARLYRTGDLARWRPEGTLEVLGRIDHQVKVRGFRIELGEIEAALRALPEVGEAAVIVHEAGPEPGGERLLAAFVTAAPGADPASLRESLRGRLPDYMVPAFVMALDALPLTPNGKIDRRALGTLAAGARPATGSVPPRDALELRLVELWEELLGVHPIGVTDDFFALGGHSLLAVRLMSRLRRSTGRDLPLTTLFQASTVERLARVLRREEAPERSALVALRAAGSRPPFFCVHPVGGHVFRYLDLARRLPPEQPFYAFQMPALEAGVAAAPSIESLAEQYLSELRKVRPRGPYLLGGWSMGGAVAYEMARRLEAQGERVALLALLDTRVPQGGQAPEEDEMSLLVRFALDLGLRPGLRPEDGGLTLSGLRDLPEDERLARVLAEAQRRSLLPPDTEVGEIRRLFEAFRVNLRALRQWKPEAWGGRVTLFRPDGEASAYAERPDAGWSAFASGGVEIVSTPGDHYSLVHEPQVGTLADRLGALLLARSADPEVER